jgi:hypothetical protein
VLERLSSSYACLASCVSYLFHACLLLLCKTACFRVFFCLPYPDYCLSSTSFLPGCLLCVTAMASHPFLTCCLALACLSLPLSFSCSALISLPA